MLPEPAGATHILSVDVEDYFQTEAFSSTAPRREWDQYPSRVEANTLRLLDIFEHADAKATFFVLGWVADRFPSLVREIAARGHELACHSYWHRTVYSLDPETFREDTRSAIRAIEDASGIRVSGYRAPTWSITRNSLWALRILAEEGITYDSSIFPIRHDLYGIPGAPAHPYFMKAGEQSLLEVPPATLTCGPFKFPAAGGGYLRIFPLLYTRLAIQQIEKKSRPAVIYLHPWEIDPKQPRLAGSRKSRFRQYFGLDSLEKKLCRLLASYRFTTFERRCEELSREWPSIAMPADQLEREAELALRL
jgi:polysaccharide deacetylase family protein (PEP-CTERM system associated)